MESTILALRKGMTPGVRGVPYAHFSQLRLRSFDFEKAANSVLHGKGNQSKG